MSLFRKCYQSEKRETVNSLIRYKTPYPDNSPSTNFMVDLCCPCRLIEAITCITCGSFLWFLPCTVCKMETKHYGNDVDVEKCSLYPRCRTPNPCGYEDTIHEQASNSHTNSKGYEISCNYTNLRPKGYIPIPTNVTSTITGYQCINSGLSKILYTIENLLCIPCDFVKIFLDKN